MVSNIGAKNEILKLVKHHRRRCLEGKDDSEFTGEDCNINLRVVREALEDLNVELTEEEKKLLR